MAAVGMAGGLDHVKPANAEVQALCNQVRKQVEQEVGRSFISFRALHYKTQVVAGVNYYVKVYVGYNEYIHLRIFKPLPYTNQPISLSGVQLCKTRQDQITAF